MADITKLGKLVNGFVQNIDLTSDTLVLGSIKLGGASGTSLSKAQLDSLLANSHASGSDNQTISVGDGMTGGGSGATVAIDLALDGTTLSKSASGLKVNEIANAQVADGAAIAESKLALDYSTSSLNTAIGTKISSSEKGSANGVATLDAGGKVPVGQLPSAVMTYEGVWNATTNSPALADGSGDAGMVYRVGTAGTQNLGSGAISFEVGDYVIYNGTVWEKSDTTDAVASVNGFTGVVVLDTDDISEGSANLYFTVARARSAAVVNSTAGSETDQAASVSAMKSYVASQVGSSVGGLYKTFTNNTGSAITAGSLVAASSSVSGEIVLADSALLSTSEGFIGVVVSTINNGASGQVQIAGEATVDNGSVAFDLGKRVYLGLGIGTKTAPTADATAVVLVGIATATNKVILQPQLVGVN